MLLSALLMTAAVVAADTPVKAPSAEDYVGRWNVLITDTGDTFRGAWFKIEKQTDGLAAQMVWRWGSVVPVKAKLKDGALVLVREEKPGQRDVFEARREGAVLRGQVHYADGKVHHFEARRAPELAAAKRAVKWGAPVTLFDGQTLNGWRLRDPKAKLGWAAQNGELAVVDPKDNADLVTDRTFQDLRLHLEFNIDPKSNSGVYLRGRYEIQLVDDPQLTTESHGMGALYSRIAPALDATKPAGEWQTLDVTFVGRRLTVQLNGKTIIDNAEVEGITGGAVNPFEGEPGPLMLQGDHGKVRFRHIVITPAL